MGNVIDLDRVGGGGSGTGWSGSVNTFADLPNANDHLNEVWVVRTKTGSQWTFNLKRSGLYIAEVSGWRKLSNAQFLFSDNEFTIKNSADETKQIHFDASTITTGQQRTLSVQDKDYTIASDEDLRVDDTDLEVITGVLPQQVAESIDSALVKARGTEVLTGTASINADPTRFDVSAVVGQIKDSTGYYPINAPAVSGVLIDDISSSSTWIYYDKNGVLQQQTTEPTTLEWRQKLFLKRFASNGVQLIASEVTLNPSGQYSNSIRDVYDYLLSAGVPLKKGLDVIPNTDRTFKRGEGSVLEFGGTDDEDQRNTPFFSLQAPAILFTQTRSSSVAGPVSNVPHDQYDNGGVLSPISNNKFVAHRLYFFTSGNQILQYGQNEYNSLSEAETSILTESYVVNPATNNGLLLGWWIVKKDYIALNNIAECKFVPYSIGGQSTGSALAQEKLTLYFSLTGQANSTFGLLSKSSEDVTTNPSGKPTTNPFSTFQNGSEDPYPIRGGGVLTRVLLTLSTCAVAQATVGANPTLRLDVYRTTGSGRALIRSIDVPIPPANVDINNNLGNNNFITVSYATSFLLPATNEGIGVQFTNRNANNNQINAVSRLMVTTIITYG